MARIPSNDRSLWCRFYVAICLKRYAHLYRWPSTCLMFSYHCIGLASLRTVCAMCMRVCVFCAQTTSEHWRNKFEVHVFNYCLPFMLRFIISTGVFCSFLFVFSNRIMAYWWNCIRGLKQTKGKKKSIKHNAALHSSCPKRRYALVLDWFASKWMQ